MGDHRASNMNLDIELCSYQSLIEEQIRAIEFSRRKQDPPPLPGLDIRVVFLDDSASRGGTGVFLPRRGSTATSTASASASTTNKSQGKGCSRVLIPARVVEALQLHFYQMAATSAPKPPLHDVVVRNRDGMYSQQKREEEATNEMILPQEWTY